MTHFVICSGKSVTIGPTTYVRLLGHVDLRPPPLGFAENVVQLRPQIPRSRKRCSHPPGLWHYGVTASLLQVFAHDPGWSNIRDETERRAFVVTVVQATESTTENTVLASGRAEALRRCCLPAHLNCCQSRTERDDQTAWTSAECGYSDDLRRLIPILEAIQHSI